MLRLNLVLREEVARRVRDITPESVKKLYLYPSRRWAGRIHGWLPATQVFVTLPKDTDVFWKLFRAVFTVARTLAGDESRFLAAARRNADMLVRKCAVTLGLPGTELTDDERPFVATIASQPNENVAWLVYADWLEERCNANATARAGRIRNWHGDATTKTRRGFPVDVTGDIWRRWVPSTFLTNLLVIRSNHTGS
jgi:uncharacterized protein (TIGR02996 family)